MEALEELNDDFSSSAICNETPQVEQQATLLEQAVAPLCGSDGSVGTPAFTFTTTLFRQMTVCCLGSCDSGFLSIIKWVLSIQF